MPRDYPKNDIYISHKWRNIILISVFTNDVCNCISVVKMIEILILHIVDWFCTFPVIFNKIN
jgi:hypothetical protein